VLGDGKLAQLIARVLRTSGLRVVMIRQARGQVRLARLAGIETAQSGGRVSRRADAFALVVEATGSPSVSQWRSKSPPARHARAQIHISWRRDIETWQIVVKELTVVGSRCGPFPPALALLRSGGVDPPPADFACFPLKDAAEAIRHAQRPGVMKVLLRSQNTESKQ